MKKAIRILVLSAAIAGLTACGGPNRTVNRRATDEVIDISGNWNDTDSQMTSRQLVQDVLSRGWLPNFREEEDRKPVVIVGTIRNRSSEHINTSTIVKDFEKELINSGKVKFVASKKERQELRDERMNQQTNATMDSAKRLAAETGADFMLQGTISTIIDAADGTKLKYYQVNMELINLENNEKVWMGDKKIKKLVQQDSNKW